MKVLNNPPESFTKRMLKYEPEMNLKNYNFALLRVSVILS